MCFPLSIVSHACYKPVFAQFSRICAIFGAKYVLAHSWCKTKILRCSFFSSSGRPAQPEPVLPDPAPGCARLRRPGPGAGAALRGGALPGAAPGVGRRSLGQRPAAHLPVPAPVVRRSRTRSLPAQAVQARVFLALASRSYRRRHVILVSLEKDIVKPSNTAVAEHR